MSGPYQAALASKMHRTHDFIHLGALGCQPRPTINHGVENCPDCDPWAQACVDGDVGCYLEIIDNERLVWTDALLPGYRPSLQPFVTAVIALEARGRGTQYTAIARHADEAIRRRHEEMRFVKGCGTALDQLVAQMKSL